MHSLSRREFLRLSSLTAAATVAAACAQPAAPGPAAPDPVAEQPTTAPAAPGEGSRYVEAPALVEQVTGGSLPPVEERLPKDPVVVSVWEEIGQYGGVWHRCAVGPNDVGVIRTRFCGEPFLRFTTDASAVVPNVIKSYEINEDATEFTFFLREGMKWSDGVPYTADNFVFWYEDHVQNADLTPTLPKWATDPTNGELMVLEKVDDYTFQIKFESPYGLFIQIVSGAEGTYFTDDYAAHYMKQFHPTYADEAELAAKVEAAGFTNWWELYNDRRGHANLERPHIWAWVPTRMPPDIPAIIDRNPYYWKVDAEGQQLPYIDAVHFDIVENADLLNMKAVAGEIDMQHRHITWTNFPLFIENAEAGDYRVLQWPLAEGSNCCLHPNMNHQDPVLRELMQTKEFRIALSEAIDRDAIHQLAYQGFGEPRQAALIPECPWFKEEHATKYANHDVDLANELLDGIGLTERDDEGFRTRPDGTPLSITVEYAPVFGPWGDTVNMVCEQWKEIGIRGIAKEEDRTLFSQRATAGLEMDMGVWMMDRCITPIMEPWFFLPFKGGTPPSTAALWWDWYQTKGEQGEEPPEEVKAQYDLWDACKGAAPDALPPLAEQFFDNAAENVWFIGTVGRLPNVGVCKNNFRNVPEDAVQDWAIMSLANTNPEQYFWKQA
ncbi:MAG: ABC transporter substrate-binding protein [Chloroflexi bacterium]|nr:ABC transporter substrate-binding protein [Chloroflexota bacterium]